MEVTDEIKIGKAAVTFYQKQCLLHGLEAQKENLEEEIEEAKRSLEEAEFWLHNITHRSVKKERE